ncbi:adenylate cyclase type 2 isoform X2 [Neodiprion virginianus]|uniref:adenylate cyclase type 2 isoform X2 n=1 Tax=Neodiprion fabricii TaxID=2872261 RepID=UPI001ED8F780|nr:adenylate cyclase type 2 isoform X2 [Neodiprion fabricii]XP_046606914.1 adenylate cyclase type 2 isoform X2 [Neodiprion virginianus]
MDQSSMELVARTSLTSLKVDAARIVSANNLDDWTWTSLRKQFKYKNLEKLYLTYQRRLQHGYLSLFIILHGILIIVHSAVLVTMGTLEGALPDVITYSVIGVLLCPLITLSCRTKFVAKDPCVPVLLSCLTVALLVIGDVAMPLYRAASQGNNTPAVRPAYATHTLLACYVFLPLTENLHAFLLGMTATLCHLVSLALVTYKDERYLLGKLVPDAIYFICVNGLGLYFRFMNEVIIRRSFLDRRKCVESTLKLNYEKEQEEQLTRSILPQHIAAQIKKDFRNIFKFMEEHNTIKQKTPYNDLYVETHKNVSILYADVVNFSGLTVTLPVQKLVETLNDLFGSFDEASEKHNVLRIKFLGDCYYCVSGVPNPNAHHAKSCVDLGLDMIQIIRKVRELRGLDVDMRIGVHSGTIISGIIGANKWQYDVWSRDVVIANKMEQTGRAGKVHVTQQTLNLLDVSQYNCTPVESVNNETLNKYKIKTYLLTPSPSPLLISHDRDLFENSENLLTPDGTESRVYLKARRSSARPSISFSAKNKTRSQPVANGHADVTVGTFRRRTAFMGTNLRQYQQMLKTADAHMETAIQQMPLSKFEQWFKAEHLNPFFLTFHDLTWELPFMRESDPLFKFYVSCAGLVLVCMGFMTLVPSLTQSAWHVSTGIAYGIAMAFLVLLLPFTWLHYAWTRWKDPHEEQEGHVPQPENKLLLFMYQTSVKVVWSTLLRTCLYLVITILLAACAMVDMVVECENVDYLALNNITSSITAIGASDVECNTPQWQMTQTCSLAILMSFLFLRIHFCLKLIIGCSIMGFYTWNIWVFRSALFQSGESWNPQLEPRVAHILSVVFLTFSLHIIDRQAEYLNRLDYQWKRQLTKEQDEAFHTRNANKMLLRNILPEHVAEFYLNTNRNEEQLYHKPYDTVAVMFASLTELSMDETDLTEKNILIILNQIICEFDKLLFQQSFLRVEKIKVAGTTYMAACGLDAGHRDSLRSSGSGSLDEDGESDGERKPGEYRLYHEQEHVVTVMTRFAAQMMHVLDGINREKISNIEPYKLRIGISHGEVTAGVVGAQKPLYDIWGDAVNMASRMDTTGVPGKIQVTKETAALLEQQGVKCELRGDTYVKPKGLVTTYFVAVNERRQIQRLESIQETRL